MTIHEIKDRTKETHPYFFSPDTLRFFRQKLSDFTVTEQTDGRYKISAPCKLYNGHTVRFFNPETNELNHE